MVFITPKMPPIDITPVTNRIATMNCLLVSLSRSKYSVSGVACNAAFLKFVVRSSANAFAEAWSAVRTTIEV